MRLLRLGLALVASIAVAGCFQSNTLIKVNADGSGTIDERLLMTSAALAQLRAFSSFGGKVDTTLNPINEDQVRAEAAAMGPGVTYVSSTPVTNGEAQGRAIVYAFADINQVRISEQPSVPGGMMFRTQELNPDAAPAITFALARQPNGNMLLRVIVPQPHAEPADPPAPRAAGRPSSLALAQTALIKQFFTSAQLAVTVEPSGKVVRTSSPFVDAQRVTLLDVDFDQVMTDPDVVSRLQHLTSVDAAKIALKGAPGVRILFDPEITIEFTSEK
jgi:hypothetical protein